MATVGILRRRHGKGAGQFAEEIVSHFFVSGSPLVDARHTVFSMPPSTK